MPRAKRTTGENGENVPFDQVLSRLQTLVEQLEGGKLSLEQALQVYEEGVGLAGIGHKVLDNAEKRVELLVQRGDKQTVEPLDEPTSGSNQDDE